LDNTQLTASKIFYIRNENMSETNKIIEIGSNHVDDPAFFSQRNKYIYQYWNSWDSRIKIRPSVRNNKIN
jgi:hypothetical protein